MAAPIRSCGILAARTNMVHRVCVSFDCSKMGIF